MRRHALLSVLRRGVALASCPDTVGRRGVTSFTASAALRASSTGVPRAVQISEVFTRNLTTSSRWYATGRAGASGPFAMPHPTRADTLRYPARAAGAAAALDPKLKGAMVGRPDPLASRGEGPTGGPRATAFDRLVYYPILFLAAVELLVWYSVAATSPNSEQQEVENWSATKKTQCERYVQPETTQQVKEAVEWAHVHRKRLRPVGSALSPNGAAFNEDGMISLGLLDEVLEVDKQNMTVTVQAGARVLEVTEKLRPHGLTLLNYASIREQQIGGFTQVGAHGTGALIPPLDETVVKLKLITPGKGEVVLSETDPDGGEALCMARCGVGALGVATEVTMKVVKSHRLLEKTWCATRSEIARKHTTWLKSHQHIRYMWIPYTDTVVVVGSNPLPEGKEFKEPALPTEKEQLKKTEPMRKLLKQVSSEKINEDEVNAMGFGELRDALLKIKPLNLEHVKRVNNAEAEFWKRNTGTRCDWSDQILGFDCGGQQHVYEVAFKTGDSLDANTGADLRYMDELLSMIESEGIPAPAPIEQRWSAGSASPLSPATNCVVPNDDGSDVADTKTPQPPGLHSWIGIIMYLPSDDKVQRHEITNAFKAYSKRETEVLGDKYQIKTHWAKIELPETLEEQKHARATIEKLYDVAAFQKLRMEYDPKGVLGNDMIEGLLGDPARVAKRDSFSEAFWGPLEKYVEEQYVADELKKMKSKGTGDDDDSNNSTNVEPKSFHRHLERKFARAVEDGSLVNVSIQIAMAVALHVTIQYKNLMRKLREEDEKRAAAKTEAAAEADRMSNAVKA